MASSSVLDDLAGASALVADLVEQVPADRWTAPTPCSDWHVRDLVGHLVGMDLVLVSLLGQGPRPERGSDVLGEDPAGAYRRSAAALLAASSLPGVLEATQETPLGTTTTAQRLRWRVLDLLVHAWDLGRATGLAVDLPDDLVEPALELALAELPAQPRSGRFADPRPVPTDASAVERLVAATGRDPRP